MTSSNLNLRLTSTVKKGGCAAKVAAHELRDLLGRVQFPPRLKELMVDGEHFDDAAILRIDENLALVQTLDFFTPIVDSPTRFGRIAAVNALSDVYAMGGKPKTAMAILAFPLGALPNEVIAEVLQGACDAIGEAGASLVGGHSIDDDTLKFGLSVTGFVHPDRIWSNTGARVGDRLILTKGLGTGTLTAALKREALTEADISAALDSMAQLNNVIDFLSPEQQQHVHAATDITGFGLAGHGMQLAQASQCSLRIDLDRTPTLPRADEFLQKEFLTKAHKSNRDYTAKNIRFSSQTPLWRQQVVFDPQTSGGLLLAVSAESASSIVQSLQTRFPRTALIGEVRSGAGEIIFDGESRA